MNLTDSNSNAFKVKYLVGHLRYTTAKYLLCKTDREVFIEVTAFKSALSEDVFFVYIA